MRIQAGLLVATVFLLAAPCEAQTPQPAPAIDANLRAKIDSDVRGLLRASNTPGATVAIIENGATVYTRAYGLRDVANKIPADADTRFEVGSITKQFVGAAILQLKEAGKIDLDAPLSTYLPTVPHASDVTVRELVTHTSGLRDYMDAANIETLVGTPATFGQLIARIADKPLDFKPGTQWEYSNTNYIVLGHLIETVSGQTWEAYAQTHLFAPANMTETASIAEEPRLPDMASGYVYAHDKSVPSIPLDESWASSAGGLVTTAGDLAKWDEALSSGRIISASDYGLLTTPQLLADGSSTEYAFGLKVDSFEGQPRIWHDGNTFGFDASSQYFPNQNVNIVVLTNALDGGSSLIVAHIFNDLFPSLATTALQPLPDAGTPIAAPPEAPGATPIAPDDLYLGAVARLRSFPQQPFLSYIMAYVISHKGDRMADVTLSVVERRSDRRSWNKTLAGGFSDWQGVGHVSIGRHYLIPDAFLPYRNESAPEGELPTFDAPDPSLRTIAQVHSALNYTITLVDDEMLDGCGAAAHLQLRPRHDPQRYNIRDMWVRRSDFRLCQAVFASHLYQSEGKGGTYPTIITAQLDSSGKITRYSLFTQIHLLIATNSETTIGTFKDVRWSSDRPSYLFDYTAWQASNGAYRSGP